MPTYILKTCTCTVELPPSRLQVRTDTASESPRGRRPDDACLSASVLPLFLHHFEHLILVSVCPHTLNILSRRNYILIKSESSCLAAQLCLMCVSTAEAARVSCMRCHDMRIAAPIHTLHCTQTALIRAECSARSSLHSSSAEVIRGMVHPLVVSPSSLPAPPARCLPTPRCSALAMGC